MGFIEHNERRASQLLQGELPSGGTRPGHFFFKKDLFIHLFGCSGS